MVFFLSGRWHPQEYLTVSQCNTGRDALDILYVRTGVAIHTHAKDAAVRYTGLLQPHKIDKKRGRLGGGSAAVCAVCAVVGGSSRSGMYGIPSPSIFNFK